MVIVFSQACELMKWLSNHIKRSAVQKVSPLAEHLLSNQIGWTKMCVNMLKCSEWTSPCEMNFLTQEHSTHVPVIDVAEWVASKPKPFGFSLSKHSHWYNIYHPWTYQVVGFPAQYKAELDWTTLNKSKQIRAHTQPQASLKNYIYPAKGYNGWKVQWVHFFTGIAKWYEGLIQSLPSWSLRLKTTLFSI